MQPIWATSLVFVLIGSAGFAQTLENEVVQALPTEVAQSPSTVRPTLKLGSTGSLVEELQALLTLLGYYENAIDGNYQTPTEDAVSQFQLDTGLSSDGVVGPATWEKLLPTPSTNLSPPAVVAQGATNTPSETQNELIELPTLKTGVRGSAVTRVQETLAFLGFYQGPIDGIFGPDTEKAVMAFQRNAGLVDDGIIGPATWRELLR
ncbi:MAG: peptidoglycan-binding protein [Cyanobacteria bacterium P01_H01_bin.58]